MVNPLVLNAQYSRIPTKNPISNQKFLNLVPKFPNSGQRVGVGLRLLLRGPEARGVVWEPSVSNIVPTLEVHVLKPTGEL